MFTENKEWKCNQCGETYNRTNGDSYKTHIIIHLLELELMQEMHKTEAKQADKFYGNKETEKSS